MHGSFISDTRISRSWLFSPPFRGLRALFLSLAAVAVPTIIGLGMLPQMDPKTCTIFCPFVLATSILCGWRYAVAVTLGSAITGNMLMMGQPYRLHFAASDIEALAIFLGFSAFMILVVALFRLTAARSLRQAGARERMSGVVFSVEDGQVWASWYGVDAPVRLGPCDQVVEMMEDFLAQVELGKSFELSRRIAENTPGRQHSDRPHRASATRLSAAISSLTLSPAGPAENEPLTSS